MRTTVALLALPVLGGVGAAVGFLIGFWAGQGSDPIVHPMLWATPLGGVIGMALGVMILIAMVISKK